MRSVAPLGPSPNLYLAHEGWEAFRWVETFKDEPFYFTLKLLFKEKCKYLRNRSDGGVYCLYLEFKGPTSCLQSSSEL